MALYTPARRCPACYGELNLRITGDLRALLEDADPETEVMRVLCRWETNRQTCGELVVVRVGDIQRARLWSADRGG